jgi:beta-galactosidase
LAEDRNPQIRPKPETIFYGAPYYHEYMPYERLVQDIALMKDAGISVALDQERVLL